MNLLPAQRGASLSPWDLKRGLGRDGSRGTCLRVKEPSIGARTDAALGSQLERGTGALAPKEAAGFSWGLLPSLSGSAWGSLC